MTPPCTRDVHRNFLGSSHGKSLIMDAVGEIVHIRHARLGDPYCGVDHSTVFEVREDMDPANY